MSGRRSRAAAWGVVLMALFGALAGCSSKPTKAPVEDRSSSAGAPGAPAAPAAPAAEPAAKPLPGAENAGKPGYYTVKPGDTLIRIALEHGQNWRDLARWNALENPNIVEVGQVLRVMPPAPAAAPSGTTGSSAAATRPVSPPGRVESRPLEPRTPAASTPTSTPPPASGSSSTVAAAPAVRPSGSAPPGAPAAGPSAAEAPAASAEEELVWAWPAAGAVLAAFDEGRNKGLTIGGKLGDPVLAAANGRVIYVGSSIRGYGNLVIVKHNDTFLSAYAHNQQILVKEDQIVRRGQRIADMGSSDADRVQLQFEIRRQGKPVDPSRFLPPR